VKAVLLDLETETGLAFTISVGLVEPLFFSAQMPGDEVGLEIRLRFIVNQFDRERDHRDRFPLKRHTHDPSRSDWNEALHGFLPEGLLKGSGG
jgi:hypothetical protein